MNEIRIVKLASCPSLSGRSVLGYHIGVQGEEIFIRLYNNSEGGLFSKEWVALEQFELTEGTPITSSSLHTLFMGKSANSAGFLMAVLKSEGLIKPIEEKSRTYKRCDPGAFKEAIQALMGEEVSLEEAPPALPRQKKGRKG